MENFITGHLLCEDIDVYCGGENKFRGKVVGCADGVLTLETDPAVLTHVSVDKIVAVWPKAGEMGAAKPKARAPKAGK
jgi:hypothetical protein